MKEPKTQKNWVFSYGHTIAVLPGSQPVPFPSFQAAESYTSEQKNMAPLA